jgi:hypothetical protein
MTFTISAASANAASPFHAVAATPDEFADIIDHLIRFSDDRDPHDIFTYCRIHPEHPTVHRLSCDVLGLPLVNTDTVRAS